MTIHTRFHPPTDARRIAQADALAKLAATHAEAVRSSGGRMYSALCEITWVKLLAEVNHQCNGAMDDAYNEALIEAGVDSEGYALEDRRQSDERLIVFDHLQFQRQMRGDL